MIANEVQPVMLLFRAGLLPARQAQLLHEFMEWDGIADARPLVPEATNAVVARMAYVYVSEGVDLKDVCQRLENLDEIESATLPAVRHIV